MKKKLCIKKLFKISSNHPFRGGITLSAELRVLLSADSVMTSNCFLRGGITLSAELCIDLSAGYLRDLISSLRGAYIESVETHSVEHD